MMQFDMPNAKGFAWRLWKFYLSLYMNSKEGVHITLSFGVHRWEISIGASQWDK